MENNLMRKDYNFNDVALATFLFVVFTLAFEGLMMFVPRAWFSNLFAVCVFQTLIEALFAVVAYLIARNRKLNIFEVTGMKKKVNLKIVGLAFLISVLCLIFFGGLTNVFIDFLNFVGYHSKSSDIVIDSFGKYIVYVVSLCVAPAIFEEMLFRGTILKGLKCYGATIAILVSAAIFMIMHGSPDQTIHQFVIGIIVGYIFFKTGNLWIGVLVHFFNNFISVTQIYGLTIIQNSQPAAEEAVEVASSNPTFLSLILSLVYSLIFASIGYMLVVAILKSISSENEKLNSAKAGESVISVDGKEQIIELAVEGQVVTQNTENGEQILIKTNQKISSRSRILFFVAGAILVGMWLLTFISGFVS